MDSWQTRLEEGEDQLTRQQEVLARLSKPTIDFRNDENVAPPPTPKIPEALLVKIPESQRRVVTSSTKTTTIPATGTPRRALSEASTNTPRSSPRRSPRKSKDVRRSSMSLKQKRNEAPPEIMIYVDPADA